VTAVCSGDTRRSVVPCSKPSVSYSPTVLIRELYYYYYYYYCLQQIIEEGPITVAPRETVKALEQVARRLAKAVRYVGAATVEYLYSMETGEYYFLELNP
jgi:biotin carboxylase